MSSNSPDLEAELKNLQVRRNQRNGRYSLPVELHRNRRLLRYASDWNVRLVPQGFKPASRKYDLGHTRKLCLRPDRLSSTRRTNGMDRRYSGILTYRQLPVRYLWFPLGMDERCGGRNGRHGRRGTRDCTVYRRSWRSTERSPSRLGRLYRHDPVGPVRKHCRLTDLGGQL